MTGRRSDAEILARAFLDEFGIEWIVDVRLALRRIGLTIREVEGVSFDGALVRVAGLGRGKIAVRRDIREDGRKLFTIAHEVGHYISPHHGLEPSLCRGREVQSWSLRLAAKERDANVFAAEILLPREVLVQFVLQEPSFRHVGEIALRRRTSLTATAARYVEVAERRLALVCSHKGKVVWYRTSAEFGRGIPKGRVGQRTVAGRIFAGGEGMDEFVEVPAINWLYDANLAEDATILEWSRALPFYDSVLTLLYIENAVEVKRNLDDGEGSDSEEGVG